MKPTSLYRLFGADGELLYVGVAGNPGRRFEQHAGDKPWWGEVVGSTIEHFPDRASAEAAERAAIRDEQPRYNIAHNSAVMGTAVLYVETIRMVCSGCGKAISPAPGSGYLEVDDSEAYQRHLKETAALKTTEERLYADLSRFEFHQPLQWFAHHVHCDPNPDGDNYYIDADRLTSWVDLMEWNSHLSEKNWIHQTDWYRVLQRINSGSEPLRSVMSKTNRRLSTAVSV